MNNKNKLFLIIATTFICIIAVFFISCTILKKSNNKHISTLTPNKETSENINSNLSLYGNTTSVEDSKNYPLQVNVTNLSELGKTSIPDYGLSSLEEYLSRYVSHYLGTENNFKAVYVENSYRENINFPIFFIKITGDEDIQVKCVYKVVEQRYSFYSKLSEQ